LNLSLEFLFGAVNGMATQTSGSTNFYSLGGWVVVSGHTCRQRLGITTLQEFDENDRFSISFFDPYTGHILIHFDRFQLKRTHKMASEKNV
jgi:hypothetical protein